MLERKKMFFGGVNLSYKYIYYLSGWRWGGVWRALGGAEAGALAVALGPKLSRAWLRG